MDFLLFWLTYFTIPFFQFKRIISICQDMVFLDIGEHGTGYALKFQKAYELLGHFGKLPRRTL